MCRRKHLAGPILAVKDMPKRLIVCCDGTWNDPEDKTHIHWICEHCQRQEAGPLQQEVGYFAGVGTIPGEILSGGAVGLGLSRNIRAAYRFVRDNWKPGDELFVFGFSRGAYTARSLSGFIGRVGWLDRDEWVDAAYLWYRLSRSRPDDKDPSLLSRILGSRVQERTAAQIDVTFLGVFDTVGALGIPFRSEDAAADLGIDRILDRVGLSAFGNAIGALEDRVRRPVEGFHDTELGPHVKNAYQALAVDERRSPFLPTLWTKVPPTSTVEQAWFAGVHGDIGGNYHEPDGERLAAIPLLWMMEKATAVGLDLKPGALQALRDAADPLAPQHDSLDEFWRFALKLGPIDAIDRPIGNAARRQRDPSGRRFPVVEANETIHPAVRKRLGQRVELRRDQSRTKTTYHPAGLSVA
jgi:uncharacterized protein (DUF2235 family)